MSNNKRRLRQRDTAVGAKRHKSAMRRRIFDDSGFPQKTLYGDSPWAEDCQPALDSGASSTKRATVFFFPPRRNSCCNRHFGARTRSYGCTEDS
ncbi:MAG: hypothetical protein P4M11_08910 [Candidatus Pacebacteria bacterium]|nr:hypothetical protein [Candidatus Paceibacterota bacterium]